MLSSPTMICVQCSSKGSYRPQTPQELFNLWHAALRNPVERIFGVIKRRWPILSATPQYSFRTQAEIVPALCALHNFIRWRDPYEIEMFGGVQQTYDECFGMPSNVLSSQRPVFTRVTRSEQLRADTRRDDIANAMWTHYQNELSRRADGIDM
jgi:hypothetical protein